MILRFTALFFALATLHAESEPMKTETAILGGGCFWCVEAVYERLPGVMSVTSGYAGGQTENPTYEQIGTGKTGHAEVVQIEYDPEKISFQKIIDLFWDAHDPTTLNRQGADVGTQYRSAVFTSTNEQARVLEQSRDKYQAALSRAQKGQITTELVSTQTPITGVFYPAEAYHQQYLHKVPNGYCGLQGTGVTCS